MELSLIYKWILQLHSLWSIITLSLLIYTTFRSFYKLSKNKIFTNLDLRIALFGLIFSFFQFIFAPIDFKLFRNFGNDVLIESLSSIFQFPPNTRAAIHVIIKTL